MIGKILLLLILILIGTYVYVIYTSSQSGDIIGVIVASPFLLFTLIVFVLKRLWTLWEDN